MPLFIPPDIVDAHVEEARRTVAASHGRATARPSAARAVAVPAPAVHEAVGDRGATWARGVPPAASAAVRPPSPPGRPTGDAAIPAVAAVGVLGLTLLWAWLAITTVVVAWVFVTGGAAVTGVLARAAVSGRTGAGRPPRSRRGATRRTG